MCQETNSELDRGNQAAGLLVDHLRSMGAGKATLNVEREGVLYEVQVSVKSWVISDAMLAQAEECRKSASQLQAACGKTGRRNAAKT